MSGEDRRWNEFEQQLRAQPPRHRERRRSPRGGRLRKRLFQLAEGRAFEFGLTLTLLANAVMLCTQHAGEPARPHARARARWRSPSSMWSRSSSSSGAAAGAGRTSNSHDNVAAFCMLSSVIDSALYRTRRARSRHGRGVDASLFRALRLLRLLRSRRVCQGSSSSRRPRQAALLLIGRIAIVIMMEVLVFAQGRRRTVPRRRLHVWRRNTNASFQNTFRAMQLLWLAGTGEMWWSSCRRRRTSCTGRALSSSARSFSRCNSSCSTSSRW